MVNITIDIVLEIYLGIFYIILNVMYFFKLKHLNKE